MLVMTPVRPSAAALLLVAALAASARADDVGFPAAGGARFDSLITRPEPAPERVEISQMFLAFESSIPRQTVARRRAAADSLARHVLRLARGGAAFDSLVKVHSDLKRGSRVVLVNNGVAPAAGEKGRRHVEPAVGDMAFGLGVGQTGLVVPDGKSCRYGYYVIHRWK